MLATPTRMDSPADRRRAETKDEILRAAWELCREEGLAGLSLRELAERVGMRAPSLYSYFGSKHDIYDAMFAAGQHDLRLHRSIVPDAAAPREVFRQVAHAFFRFCTDDPVRYQLMFQRTIPGFEPSAESYAMAQEHLDWFASQLALVGVTDARFVDLWTAMISGLTSQQISNDPGGDRWAGLLYEVVDLFCDHAGIPPMPPQGERTMRSSP